ncbi:DUF3040 domain-containing protein [Actinoplanes sp. KI2]|uniref:DUF3040 domain-containing protein n=1 Tax=Actinoplanes sp. KI2 TaxID=2983315 RepID=UPI0021D60E0F|nr:DUF3040 domain-containing protein [Actinoplanes sp. KI2]MCU7731189.1 DUF3040 domain-containing protein [Actinoplanes sp. KI2]
MLSDAEQRRLTEIERGLRSADPAFADRLTDVTQSRPRKSRTWWIAAALIMGVAALMISPGVALIAISLAVISAAIWCTRHGHSMDGKRPPQ